MKITALTAQQTQQNRVNVMVDGAYRFSLDVYQVADLGIRVGQDYTEEEIVSLEQDSQFGKLYARALEYCIMRPHSAREIRDYLWRKTLSRTVQRRPSVSGGRSETDRMRVVEGVSQMVADRVFERLTDKGYIDDEKFARYWVENRSQLKGASRRKLIAELKAKGVDGAIIETAFNDTARNDLDELAKIIAKKRARYTDERKFIQYLARQGFGYDVIKQALCVDGDTD